RYDAGEPFSDLGLDGLAQTDTRPADLGEGNGRWDASPAFSHLLSHDADTLLESIPDAALDAMDFWVDGGIRDALHAGVVARRMVASLTTRGREPRVHHAFGGDLVPALTDDEFALQVLSRDLSAAAIGRDIYVEYGKADATPAEIANGDGKHVGTTSDAINRLAAFLAAAFSRLSAPLFEVQELDLEVSRFDSFYSEALNARRGFTVLVPPSYDAPENAERRYPVIYFLHGLGQDASDLAAVGLATSVLMSQGTLPHVLFVFPDGACCFVDRETGARECACSDAEQGLRTCVDPTCTGPEATCEKRQIPDQNLERECHRGSLYADMRSDRWGEPRTNMGYKTSVHELVDHVDQTYRTRATRPAGVPPPSGRPAR
ncbi:MAG TPA: alpha/beta hydrolase-fold protein, partial [Myxococcota bacterium]|nr:alpha/beta hydrolase-fold protein [Myxococcota bacterium]